MPYAPLAALTLIAASLLAVAGEARAGTVISHLGDANPTTEGWTESTSGSTACGATAAIFAGEYVWRVVDAPGGLTFDQYTRALTAADLSGAWWIRVRFAGNPLGTPAQDQVAIDILTGAVRIQATFVDNGGTAEIRERAFGTTLFTGIANATTALHELVITGSSATGDVQFKLDGGSPVTLLSSQQASNTTSTPYVIWGARGGDDATGTGYWQAVAFGTGTPETLATTPAPTPGGAATLVARYSFEGDTHDATGLNGATNFGATYIPDGIAGQALRFDGDDFVRAPDSATLDISGSLSLVAWVRTATAVPADYMLVSKHHTHFNRSYDIYVLTSGAPFGEVFDTANDQYDATAGASVLDGAWHQVALTYDAAAGTLTLYRDAVPVTSNAVGSRTIMDSCMPLVLGAYGASADGTTNRAFLKGDLDEVRVYRLALSAAEVAALYSTPALTRWTAGGAGGSWSSATNWDGGVPTVSADAVVPGGAVNGTVDGGFGGMIRSLTLQSGFTGTLILQRSLSIAGNLSLGSGSTLTISSSGGHSLSPASITGTGGVTRSGGTDLMNLGGANTYSGQTTISTGLVQLGSATALGATSTGTTVQNGASISIGGAWTVSEPLSIQGTGAPGFGSALLGVDGATWAGPIALLGDTQVQVEGSGTTFTIGGAISGGHGLTFRGVGDTGASIRTLVLSGANSYGGATALFEGGRLRLGASGAIPDASAVDVGSGVLDLDGFNETIGGLSGTGAVQLGAALLTVSQSADTTFSGVISGSGGLVKSGGGALVLSGASTYTGATAVNAGTLKVSGSITGAGGAVTVGGGATLRGTGSIQRAVTVASGGRISPGNSPGTLETADSTWGPGGVYEWEIDDALGTAGAAPGWDLQRIRGALAIEATSERPFTISVRSLAGAAPGVAASFSGASACAWPIATAAKGISGFAEEKFRLDLAGFSGPRAGSFRIGLSGDGKSVLVRFSAADVSGP